MKAKKKKQETLTRKAANEMKKKRIDFRASPTACLRRSALLISAAPMTKIKGEGGGEERLSPRVSNVVLSRIEKVGHMSFFEGLLLPPKGF